MLLDDLATYLQAQGHGIIGSTDDWGIFVGQSPPDPGKTITLYESGGQAPTRVMRSATGMGAPGVEQPRAQVVVRFPDGDYSTGRQKIHAIVQALENLRPQTINGIEYLWAAAVQSPFPLPPDQNHRQRLACNFDVKKSAG